MMNEIMKYNGIYIKYVLFNEVQYGIITFFSEVLTHNCLNVLLNR